MTKMSPAIPLEHDEAVLFSSWCDVMNVDCWHIPMETFTSSWGVKMRNKQEGVKKGVSDYLVYLPESRVRVPSGVLCWIELKRRRRVLKNGKLGASPSNVSDEQLDFLEKMRTVGNVDGIVAHGAQEGIDYLKKLLK